MGKSDVLHDMTSAATASGLSSDWIRKLCVRGRLSHIRSAGGLYLVLDSDLRAFLKTHKRRRIVPSKAETFQIVRTTKG